MGHLIKEMLLVVPAWYEVELYPFYYVLVLLLLFEEKLLQKSGWGFVPNVYING